MMVTHSMRQALDYGTRTVMLHEGNVVLDVSGPSSYSARVVTVIFFRFGMCYR
ncbi:hypothetical protein ACFS07_33645 [Undibacterium arcticum]